MDISYLLSVIDLYLLKENDKKTIVKIVNLSDCVKIELSYKEEEYNNTFIKIDKETYYEYLKIIISKIQSNLMIDDEVYNENNDKSIYCVTFSNKRKIIVFNFLKDDIYLFRNNLLNKSNDFTIEFEEKYESKLENNLQTKNVFSMGFSTYLTLVVISILFLDVFMISLLIFKLFVN